MIDTLTIKGPLGAHQPHHLKHLTQINIEQYLTAKSKAIVTYFKSPLTGAQIDVTYYFEKGTLGPTAFLELKIPLASAAMGHNYFHAGAKTVDLEIDVANRLSRLILNSLEFTPGETYHWLANAKITNAELTWHSKTTGASAARKLMTRTADIFNAMQSKSSRHDIAVRRVETRCVNNAKCVLVTFKSGDCFRQYIKKEEVMARTLEHRKRNPMLKDHLDRDTLHAQIEGDVRNEALLFEKTLITLELDNPRNWNQQSIEDAVQHYWANNIEQGEWVADDDLPRALGSLSPEVQQTFNRWKQGEDPRTFLSGSALTRHRQKIFEKTGRDIDTSFCQQQGCTPRFQQLNYLRRDEPRGKLRELVLSELTVPVIIAELEAGIALLVDGVLPMKSHVPWGPIGWGAFAGKYRFAVPQNVQISVSAPRRKACGIGSVRLPADYTREQIPYRKARGIGSVRLPTDFISEPLDIGGETQNSLVTPDHEMCYAATLNETTKQSVVKDHPKLPKMPGHISEPLRKYARQLAKADGLYKAAERHYRSHGLKRQAGRSRHQLAEHEYENALEMLAEFLSFVPGARTWLDRSVSFDHENSPSPDPASVPRLYNSRSTYARPNS